MKYDQVLAHAVQDLSLSGCDRGNRSVLHVVVWPFGGLPQPASMTGVTGAPRAGTEQPAVRLENGPRHGGWCCWCALGARLTSSIRTPPASFGWMKLIREFRGATPASRLVDRTPRERSRRHMASRSRPGTPAVGCLLPCPGTRYHRIRRAGPSTGLRRARHRQQCLADALIVVISSWTRIMPWWS